MTMTDRPARAPWPMLEDPLGGPRAGVGAAVARTLFMRAMNTLPVTVELARPEGVRTIGRGGPVMRIHRPDEFFARLGRDALIGFGESYMTGAWDAEHLGDFLTVPAGRLPRLVPRPLQALRRLAVDTVPRRDRGAAADSRRNVAHHYDLSNDLFELFLDPTMTYSSGWFHTDARGVPVPGDDLQTAQEHKIENILDLAGVGSGSRVLEIGTGWGGLAIHAADRGALVESITLSEEQRRLARARVDAADVGDRVRIELRDYRDLEDAERRYDAIVSVEMIEAVGWRFWPTYFRVLDRVLAPGGRVALQAITLPHDRMLATRDTYTWINKYVFPGGFLPSLRALEETATEHSALRLRATSSLGAHYAETLRQWDERFRSRHDEVRALGFDETFCRMWHFYLEYSRAGFASGYLDDHQLLFTREESE